MPADKLTLATSQGAAWATLAFHFAFGALALGSGFVALLAAKGGRWHRAAGVLFVGSMCAMGASAAVVAAIEGKWSSAVMGVFAAYLVLSAHAAVGALPLFGRRAWTVGLALLGSAVALGQWAIAALALASPKGAFDGIPAGMALFIALVGTGAAAGDARLLRGSGGPQGTRRIARHLWRMCFALFVASGSFFLGQMKFIPEALRSIPVLVLLTLAPLLALAYWMWRVRVRRGTAGLLLRRS